MSVSTLRTLEMIHGGVTTPAGFRAAFDASVFLRTTILSCSRSTAHVLSALNAGAATASPVRKLKQA